MAKSIYTSTLTNTIHNIMQKSHRHWRTLCRPIAWQKRKDWDVYKKYDKTEDGFEKYTRNKLFLELFLLLELNYTSKRTILQLSSRIV